MVCEELQEIERILYGREETIQKECTPRMAIEFARGRKLAASILHNGQVLESIPGENPPLVAALHESHLYFYSGRAKKKLSKWKSIQDKVATPTDQKDVVVKLRREHKSSATTPPANEWLPFKYKIEPGHYYASEEEMPAIRAWFLKDRRCPRVVLKDLASIGSLLYTCTKLDKGVKGSINIHSVGPYFKQIQEWLKFLPQIKHKYTGQGLPNIS